MNTEHFDQNPTKNQEPTRTRRSSRSTRTAGSFVHLKARRLGVFVLLMILLALTGLMTSCGEAPLKDGTYTERSGVDEHGYIEVSVVVKDGKISDCKMTMFNPDGSVKDENYGKNDSNPNLYVLAQKALAEASKLPSLLLERGSIDEVDAVSGATKTYDQFKAVVELILDEARQK